MTTDRPAPAPAQTHPVGPQAAPLAVTRPGSQHAWNTNHARPNH